MSDAGLTAVPEHPLLAPWATVAEIDDRLAVRTGSAAVVLEGAAAARLLPGLLPLLDGETPRAELEACFGTAVAPAVRNALGVLAAEGLLVEGPGLGGVAPAARTVALLAAAAGIGGGAPAAVVDALARRTVVVAGGGGTAALVAALVAAAGPAVTRAADGAAGNALAAMADADLVIAAPGDGDTDLLRRVDAEARSLGQPWLPIHSLDGTQLVVGPIVVPGATACLECYHHRRRVASGFGDVAAALLSAPGPPVAGPVAALVAAVAAQVAVAALVEGIGVAVPAGVAWAISFAPEVAVSRHVVHRVPRCPACSRAAALPGGIPWGSEEGAA